MTTMITVEEMQMWRNKVQLSVIGSETGHWALLSNATADRIDAVGQIGTYIIRFFWRNTQNGQYWETVSFLFNERGIPIGRPVVIETSFDK